MFDLRVTVVCAEVRCPVPEDLLLFSDRQARLIRKRGRRVPQDVKACPGDAELLRCGLQDSIEDVVAI